MKFPFFVFTFFLITLFGCTPNHVGTEPTPNYEGESVTSAPRNVLQITYIRNEENLNFGELYTLDVTCMFKEKVCIGEPKLLFRSLKTPSSEQNLPKGLLTDYSWSPDGNKIALVSGRDLLIGDINTKEWTNLTKNPDAAEHEPKWSSDGQFIYYIACIEDASGMCTPQLIRYDLIRKEKFQLLSTWNKPFTSHYDVSPDGQEIIFAVPGPIAISDLLYQANLDGSNSTQMTTEDVNENAPSFSPDGQKIAFVRSTILYYVDSEEKSDIIVKDLVSGEEKNLTEDFNGLVFSPAFSPDGEWIVFDSFDSDFKVNIFLVSLKQNIIVQVTQGNEETTPAWRWSSGQ